MTRKGSILQVVKCQKKYLDTPVPRFSLKIGRGSRPSDLRLSADRDGETRRKTCFEKTNRIGRVRLRREVTCITIGKQGCRILRQKKALRTGKAKQKGSGRRSELEPNPGGKRRNGEDNQER